MAKTQKAQVIITANASVAKKVMEELRKSAEKAKTEMKDLALMGQQNTKAFRDAQKQFEAFNSAIRHNITGVKRVEEVMKSGLKNVATRDLRRALAEGKRDLEGFTAEQLKSDAAAKKLQQSLKAIERQIQKNTDATKTFGGTTGNVFRNAVKNIGAYVGVFGVFNWAKGKLEEIYTLNKKFSDQLANIRKVSGLAMEDIDKLAVRLAKIDTRSSIQELNELAYTGSKLGFGNYGIEGLESFVKSAVKVQNALKEDMGADAMTSLSKMVEVMGLIPKMGVERAMDAAGSAIFKLASTSTATGSNIVEFSKRLMGLANIAGITTDELLAFGSASDAMALMPEVAATAFNKLITAMQKQPNLIENALNIPKGTISNLYQAGRMTDAIVAVFEKMREKGGMNALMHAGVFKDLGSDGARLVAVMATMANRVDILNTHLATSRQAFAEGTAVAQEYAIQMETAEAYSERAANMWTKAFVNPEGVDVVKQFSKAWYEMSVQLTHSEATMWSIQKLLTGIIATLKLLISIIPGLLSGGVTWGILTMGRSIATALFAVDGSAKAALVSLKGLGIAMKTNWVGWVATAVGLIGQFAFSLLAARDNMNALNGSISNFKTDLSDFNTEFGKSVSRLDRFKKAIDDAKEGTKQRSAAIANFNKQYGQYLSKMLTEKTTALELKNAYNEVTRAMRAKLALQMKEKDIEKEVATREGWAVQRREEFNKSIKGSNYEQYGGSWITAFAEDNRGRKLTDVFQDLGTKFGLSAAEVMNAQRGIGVKGVRREGFVKEESYMLLQAMNYLSQERAARNALIKVNKKWQPEQDLMNSMMANQIETRDPLEEAPDKDALKQARKEESERKKQLRKDLQDAERQSDAIISKIEEWYRMQETIITGLAADGKWTQKQADLMIDQLNIARNRALADARKGISGRDTKSWETTKQTIGQLMFDTGDWSTHLLDEILKVNLADVRTALGKIDAAGEQGISSTALRDKMDKNAAGNLREVERIERKSQQEVEKMLLQYDFLEQAIKAFDERLRQLGLLSETAADAARRIREQGEGEEPMLTQMRQQSLRSASLDFVSQGSSSMVVDYTNTEALTQWLTEFTGAEKPQDSDQYHFKGWAETFRKDFELWIKDAKRYKSEIQAFYLSLINMEDNYYKARKDDYQHRKEQQEQIFRAAGLTDEEKRTDSRLETQGKMQTAMGTGQNFWQQNGLQDAIASDPEVMRIQNRIRYRNMEYEDAQNHVERMKQVQDEEYKNAEAAGASRQQLEDLLRQQAQARMGAEDLMHERQTALLQAVGDLAQKIAAELQTRVQTIQTLSQPIADFAENAGQKLGDMMFNMESQSMTWNQLWRNMVLALAQSTVKMGAQWLTQKIQQALFYKQMEAEESLHQSIMTALAIGGATARMEGEAAIGSTSVAVNAATNSAKVGQEVSMATILTALGISEGAAKIIGSLGFWGIPLIAVISSLLLGLLASALSTAGSESAASTSAATPKVKLASGMLTYDKGNVQSFGGSKARPVLGDDGRVYMARDAGTLQTGLITQPVTTMIGGQPSLVGERGPEMVIGRETTRAMQLNRPDLLRSIIQFDRQRSGRHFRAYDEGNLDTFAGTVTTSTAAGSDATAMMTALERNNQIMAALTRQLAKGINATVAKYGKGSLDEGMREINQFNQKYKQN